MLKYKFNLGPLPYAYEALEPFFDAPTMVIHHDKHHQTYVDKLNAALENEPEWQGKDLVGILSHLDAVPEKIRTAVRNYGGGHWNHSFFWPLLKKETTLTGLIDKAIKKNFGDFEKFKADFSQSAIGLFGSGWTWLVFDNGKLKIMNTVNQDTPLSQGFKPILVLDVWEHAYYLKYQNRRPEYIEAFFQVINWDQVNQNLIAAQKSFY